MQKMLVFVEAARLQDVIEIVPDAPEHREYVAKKLGVEKVSFPALELPDRIIVNVAPDDSGEEEMVKVLSEMYGIDVSQLYAFHDFCTGMFPRYRKMTGHMIKSMGGYPGFKKFLDGDE